MHRSQQYEDGNRIQSEDRQAAFASPDCLRRREQTSGAEQLNPECATGVDETIAASVRPERCRQRSPTDVDPDRQFDSEKATALPDLTAPNAIQRVRSEPCVSVRGENYRCSQCMRPINGRRIWQSGFAMAATRTHCSTAGPRHTTHEKS